MKLNSKASIIAGIYVLILSVLIYFIGYETPRESFYQFFFLFLLSFGLFYAVYLNRQEWNFKLFFGIAIFLRVILLFAVPELSNDFYRFIWDGELINQGINPYALVPNDLIVQGPIYSNPYMRLLYHGMGELSQANYSCYPALNQFLFYIPTKFFDSIEANVISFKLMLIMADIGIIVVGKKILDHLKKPAHLIWLFALNPFVILEFSGNVHFEGVMIFFILLSIYLVLKNNWVFAAVFFGMAVLIKLIPLMLLPFLFKRLKVVPSIGFTALTAIVVILMSMILLDEVLLSNMMQSINLYFETFEFNSSLIFLLREYSFTTVGYNELTYYGPLLSNIAAVLILLLALFKAYKTEQYIFTGMLFALTIYYICATTVHPWYISMVLIFSIFTHYRFGLIWSLMIMLSYFAYSQTDFKENMLFIAIEYGLLIIVILYEVFRYTKKDNFGLGLKEFFKIGNE